MVRVAAKLHLFIRRDTVHRLHATSGIHWKVFEQRVSQWTMNEWSASLKLEISWLPSHDQSDQDTMISVCKTKKLSVLGMMTA
jgi:hypothetical protein